jgi:hypothetical protein
VSTRALLALSRFGPKLTRLTVRLAQTPNPLGGLDQSCRMRARLPRHGEVDVESTNGTIEVAVARAADRLAKRVAEALLDGGPRSDGRSALPGAGRGDGNARARARSASSAGSRSRRPRRRTRR